MSMKLKAQAAGEGGVKVPIPTAGTHSAVLVAIVDLGTHKDRYQDSGKEYDKRSVYLCWELEDADAKEGGPRFWVGADYTLSFGEKAKLRILMENWRGRKFAEGEEMILDERPLEEGGVLGRPCFLQITHKTTASGREVAQVVGASRLPKGVAAIKPTHQPLYWEVTGQPPTLPEWLPYLYGRPIVDHIAECKEMRGHAAPAAVEGEVTAPAGVGAPADIPW